MPNCKLYWSFNHFQDSLRKNNNSFLIKGDYLKPEMREDFYKFKEVLLFQIEQKKYLLFPKDNMLLEIPDKNNNIILNEKNNIVQDNNIKLIFDKKDNFDKITEENPILKIKQNNESSNLDINLQKKPPENLILIYAF